MRTRVRIAVLVLTSICTAVGQTPSLVDGFSRKPGGPPPKYSTEEFHLLTIKLLMERPSPLQSGKRAELRIPAKANGDSEGNANGILGRRRTVLRAQQRWHLDFGTSVRLRQEEPLRRRSGGRLAQARKGVRGKGRSPFPRLITVETQPVSQRGTEQARRAFADWPGYPPILGRCDGDLDHSRSTRRTWTEAHFAPRTLRRADNAHWFSRFQAQDAG